MSKEGKSISGFIHYCLNCGTQLSPEQETFQCSNCGSTTFKLKKIQKEIKGNEIENRTKRKSDELQLLGKIVEITEKTFCDKRSYAERLETVRADGIGILEIDVKGLIEGKPLILSVKEGLYEISVQKLMERVKKR